MEIRIYIADLEAYNNGELSGEWVTLPMDSDELEEVINKHTRNGQHDYAIHDYEAPFKISEYQNLQKLNETMEEIQACNVDEDVMKAIIETMSTLEEAIQIANDGDYMVFWDCDDMGDVAANYLEESDIFDSMPDNLRGYFDYEKYGRDMEIEGSFTQFNCSNGKSAYVQIF
ncbi:antirestriction protein ArdA [Paenibacillus alvei]|uniref:antirestriction protein ArdA n=1 Tax=Paenibacillus alvei TaxID=44250 RepID=UPI0022810FAE|nr:antirestriction protein ArdA [Paenibacillus alvei]MCY9738193.1 antirestriction protein ArdA [Paenibacillus alvei]